MAKILVVDDSAFMRQLLIKILNEAGYSNIVEAGSHSEALSKYESQKPDLVLEDIIIGEPDGVQVLKDIKAKNKDAKVIMVTAVGQEAIMKDAEAAGSDGYILKPFKKEEVVEKVKAVLG